MSLNCSSTVCKKKVDGDKEELQMESFTYHVEAESSALKRGMNFSGNPILSVHYLIFMCFS